MKHKIYGLGELSVKSVGDDGTFEAVVSGIKTDRYGDTINAEGWELKNYKKNPVLLWAHDHYQPAVGRALKVWQEGKELLLKGEFAPTPFGQEIKLLCEQGFIQAFSVGFMPLEWQFNDKGVDFLKQELLEVSFVNVPAYAEALMKGIDKLECKTVSRFLMDKKANELPVNNWKEIIDEEKKEIKEEEKKEEEEKIIFTKQELEDFKKDIEQKAGKVLSKKNRDLIQACIDSMDSASAPLKKLLEATTEADDEKDGKGTDGRSKETIAEKVLKLEYAEAMKIIDKVVEAQLIKLRKTIGDK